MSDKCDCFTSGAFPQCGCCEKWERVYDLRLTENHRKEGLRMRIWDLGPEKLCRKHLLAEHRELHAVWNILTKNKRGYRSHPETKRWIGKLRALYLRHEAEIREMERRGYVHRSPLDIKLATGSSIQDEFVDSIEDQIQKLRNKRCECQV